MSAEILFIAHRMPFPPNRGDKIRSHHILRHLARLAPVHVACFADDDADMAEEAELAAMAASYRLVRRGKSLALAGLEALVHGEPVSVTAFRDAGLRAYVNRLVAEGRIGAIYVFSGQMGQYVPRGFAGHVIMDFCDVDSAKFEAYAAAGRGPRSWIYAREGVLLGRMEAVLAKRADVSLLISAKEAELFEGRLGPMARGADIRVLGNGIDCDFFDPAPVVPEPRLAALPAPRLIFTGQMDYAPNVAAVERAARRIMPLVRAALPGASFHIVGRAPTSAVLALGACPGTHVWGAVPDVRPWLKGCDMALAPLEIARGVQNKVLEAMAMALPVVLTDAAATGIAAVAGQHFVTATSDAELAGAIIALAQDPARAAQIAAAARCFVVEHQSWPSALAPLAAMMGINAYAGQPDVSRNAA